MKSIEFQVHSSEGVEGKTFPRQPDLLFGTKVTYLLHERVGWLRQLKNPI